MSSQLLDLMVQVMLPVSLLVLAGAIWNRVFRDTSAENLAAQLNRLVLYLFYPSILFAAAASTPITTDLLSVPFLVAIGGLFVCGILYLLLYRSALGRDLADTTRAALMLGGMFGNTFNIGVPVLIFFYGAGAVRYAAFTDMLMMNPLIWTLGVWIATRLGSHRQAEMQPSVWRILFQLPPIWAFLVGVLLQQTGTAYKPLIDAARLIGQATIPIMIFVLGLAIPWRKLAPRLEILTVAAVKLFLVPVLAWLAAAALFKPIAEAQYAAVVEASTPTFMGLLILAHRFRLDVSAAALLIGWSTLLFWLSLPLLLAFGLIR
ncbi:MAG: AEC family transporter [Burkholderiales bacterium]